MKAFRVRLWFNKFCGFIFNKSNRWLHLLKQLIVIVLVCFSTLFNVFANAKPMTDDETNLDSFNLNVEPDATDSEVLRANFYSTLPQLTRSKRDRHGHGNHGHGHHHAGFVAGAATGAVIANNRQPTYYAPTYYYPPAYYPSSSNYYGDGYYYY